MSAHIDVGYFFEEKRTFSAGELSEMAIQCGDMNFVHHDLARAKNSRFNGIIASGSAIAAYFSALIPTHFSAFSPVLGLEMSLKFPAPIYPDMELVMRWQVEKVKTTSNADRILSLKGTITDRNGVTTVSAVADIILLEKL